MLTGEQFVSFTMRKMIMTQERESPWMSSQFDHLVYTDVVSSVSAVPSSTPAIDYLLTKDDPLILTFQLSVPSAYQTIRHVRQYAFMDFLIAAAVIVVPLLAILGYIQIAARTLTSITKSHIAKDAHQV
eukprot:gnl/Ergobibamus_cyprinoides/1095.p2 GENE.gnl/Ergobibamus_cyprinoides/1095~~gnl/Ergobibamus_cyprinoides/1095.p2  ORF type:complete len:129 (+),score=57.33 gnl/Ergobibamus_cyprinoides/1095:159-545(+)